MLEFMKGYDTSEVKYTIDSIIHKLSIYQTELRHEQVKRVPLYKFDLMMIKVLSTVRLRKKRKKIKHKIFVWKSTRYFSYQFLDPKEKSMEFLIE
jgi:hypothetical protein